MPYFLRILLTPSCWVRNYRSNPALSRKIQGLLKDGEVPVVMDEFTAKLGDMKLWIENYPYSYGGVYCGMWRGENVLKGLPDRKTVFMLHDAIYHAENPLANE